MPASSRETCWRKALTTFVITAIIFLVSVVILAVLHSCWQPVFEKEPHLDAKPEDCTSKAVVVADQSAMWNASTNLSQAWSNAEQEAAPPAHMYMEKQHSVAIYVFTQAVRGPGRTVLTAAEGSGKQLSSQARALFSDLGDALQVLRHSQRLCHTTSYTTDAPSDPNVSGKFLRFGTFVLGSGGHLLRGNTCFEVHTCFGANVSHYSALKHNSQVLIPPYELFRVSDGRSDPRRGQVTYRLESNLDCVYDKRSGSLHSIRASSASLSLLIFGIICIVIVFLFLPFVIFKVLKK